jgi:hypothetical protein
MGYAFSNEITDADGNITVLEAGEMPFWSLDQSGVAVTLMVVKGLLTLPEGAAALRLAEEHLVCEAQAWAVASEF